jgi:hypothetical protein
MLSCCSQHLAFFVFTITHITYNHEDNSI